MKVQGAARYHIDSKRLAELRNFAYQYDDWMLAAEEVTEISSPQLDGLPHGSGIGDPVARVAVARERAMRKIKMVDDCVRACTQDDNLRKAVKIAVTTPRTSFEALKARGVLYWERDAYYRAYHRFYWLLDKVRE